MTIHHPDPAPPAFTVVVPVLDGGTPFRLCLEALTCSPFRDFELVVVDDGSADGSVDAARAVGAHVLSTRGREGPAAARNLGARAARGDWLVFIDADCVPHTDTLSRMAAAVAAAPWAVAVFGSYDTAPPARGLVARYKNLMHHVVHQQGRAEAFTFWAGCGAVRRATFLALGGFDSSLYPRPSIEDIELGYRLRARGHRIHLARNVQVTHHKAWSFAGMITSDIFDRGVPWSRLIAARGVVAADLNLGWKHRLSGLVALATLAALAVTPVLPLAAAAALTGIGGFVALNLGTYRYLDRVAGGRLAIAAVPLHFLHYLCATAAFAIGTPWGLLDRVRAAGVAIARDSSDPH